MPIQTDNLPKLLVYETFSGKTYFRAGYRQVLTGLKTEEEIMGSSIFQSLIVQALVFYLKNILPKKEYWVPTNEAGLHLGFKENTSNDIVILEKKNTPHPTSEKYNESIPRFIVEVDIKIDPKDYTDEPPSGSEMDYVLQKSERLLDFGVEGIIWILSRSRKIIRITSHRNLEIFQWHETVPLFETYTFCLQTILEEEDVLPHLS
jgi:hypothetical protein